MNTKVLLLCLASFFACLLADAHFYDGILLPDEAKDKYCLVGDFNDWKLPEEDNDNGVEWAKCYQPHYGFEPMEYIRDYRVLIYLPQGKHRVALLNMYMDEVHFFGKLPEKTDAYQTGGVYTYSEFGNSILKIPDSSIEEFLKAHSIEIEVFRDYGMWFEIESSHSLSPALSIMGDGPEFTVTQNTADVEVPTETASDAQAEYYTISGVKTSENNKGVLIRVNGNRTEKILKQ